MTVLSLGSCVVSGKIPISFTGDSISSTVFSGSVWCFPIDVLHSGRLKNCGSTQSISYSKLSAYEVADKVKLTRDQKPGLSLLDESCTTVKLLCSPSPSGLLKLKPWQHCRCFQIAFLGGQEDLTVRMPVRLMPTNAQEVLRTCTAKAEVPEEM